jgi:hypothetical protein
MKSGLIILNETCWFFFILKKVLCKKMKNPKPDLAWDFIKKWNQLSTPFYKCDP